MSWNNRSIEAQVLPKNWTSEPHGNKINKYYDYVVLRMIKNTSIQNYISIMSELFSKMQCSL